MDRDASCSAPTEPRPPPSRLAKRSPMPASTSPKSAPSWPGPLPPRWRARSKPGLFTISGGTMLDLLIRGGTVIDGTGSPRRTADIGIKDGCVVAIGKVREDAARVIDADGL